MLVTKAVEALKYFRVLGVCDTELDAAGGPTNARTENGRALAGQSRDKKLNVISAGRAVALNLWKPRLPVGTILYLLLVRRRRASNYITDTMSSGTGQYRGAQLTSPDVTLRPMQLVPAAYPGSNRVPAEDLVCKDEFGIPWYGEAIRVGVVSNTDIESGGFGNPDVMSDLWAVRNSGLLTVNLAVN